MGRRLHFNDLVVTIRTGMKVRPQDARGVGIIDFLKRIRIDIATVKMLRGADITQGGNRGTQIHMVSSNHQPTPIRTKPRYRPTVRGSQSVTRIHSEQPQLIELALIDYG